MHKCKDDFRQIAVTKAYTHTSFQISKAFDHCKLAFTVGCWWPGSARPGIRNVYDFWIWGFPTIITHTHTHTHHTHTHTTHTHTHHTHTHTTHTHTHHTHTENKHVVLARPYSCMMHRVQGAALSQTHIPSYNARHIYNNYVYGGVSSHSKMMQCHTQDSWTQEPCTC